MLSVTFYLLLMLNVVMLTVVKLTVVVLSVVAPIVEVLFTIIILL
jgi:hypothetical protein